MTKKKKISPRRPSKFLFDIVRFFGWNHVKHKYNVKVDRIVLKEIKPPYILVSNHLAAIDPIIVMGSMKDVYPNCVGGYAYFQNKFFKPLLKAIGAIPKFQYQTDLKVMKDMLNVTKNGGVLSLFPSGRNSSCGEAFAVPDSLAKLVRMSKVPVVLARLEGTYLTKPKWAKERRKGRVDLTFSVLLTEEDVKTKSIPEMTKILNEGLISNDYKWNKEAQVEFECDTPAESLETTLYRCPVCGKEDCMSSKVDKLFCKECGFELKVKKTGFFDTNSYFESPFDYYEWQRVSINEMISKDFVLEDKCRVKQNTSKGIVDIGEGVISYNNSGIATFKGILNNKESEIDFDIHDWFSLPYRAGVNIELANGLDIYQFELEHGNLASKWCLTVEELYKQKKGESNNA